MISESDSRHQLSTTGPAILGTTGHVIYIQAGEAFTEAGRHASPDRYLLLLSALSTGCLQQDQRGQHQAVSLI